MQPTTQHEERLYELIEKVPFEELTTEERTFVLHYMDEANYRLQHQIIKQTQQMENTIPPVNTLHLPQKQARTIPLYQAVLAVASVVVFFLFFMPKKETTVQTIYKKGPAQVATKTIHDTIIEFRDVIYEKIIYKPLYEDIAKNDKIVEPIVEQPITFQEEIASEEKIMSLKDDPIAQQFLNELAKFDRRR
jgi:hypothetical protein